MRYGQIEIRKNPDGSLDEIFAKNVTIHIEQMGLENWWMKIADKSGKEIHVNFVRKSGVSATVYSDDRVVEIP